MDPRNVFEVDAELTSSDQAAFAKRRVLLVIGFVLALAAAAVFAS